MCTQSLCVIIRDSFNIGTYHLDRHQIGITIIETVIPKVDVIFDDCMRIVVSDCVLVKGWTKSHDLVAPLNAWAMARPGLAPG